MPPTWDEHRSLERRLETVENYVVMTLIVGVTTLACLVIGLVILA